MVYREAIILHQRVFAFLRVPAPPRELLFRIKPIRDSMDSIFHQRLAKIEQQAKTQIHHAKVGENLFLMYRGQGFKGLQLKKHTILNDQVSTKAELDFEAVPNQGYRFFTLDAQSAFGQFMSEDDDAVN